MKNVSAAREFGMSERLNKFIIKYFLDEWAVFGIVLQKIQNKLNTNLLNPGIPGVLFFTLTF